MSEIWIEIIREWHKPIVKFICPKCYEEIEYDKIPDLALVLYTVCDLCGKTTSETLILVRYR